MDADQYAGRTETISRFNSIAIRTNSTPIPTTHMMINVTRLAAIGTKRVYAIKAAVAAA